MNNWNTSESLKLNLFRLIGHHLPKNALPKTKATESFTVPC
ncbi:hypothetical protein QE193_23460 (plasmid) [Arsenophonus nasoniae]|nr:hypothetical protein [Arsenophonus nasoniae]WGM18170.1 hypothetical protein QE193_23460 [Arsenophonus nasoniae]